MTRTLVLLVSVLPGFAGFVRGQPIVRFDTPPDVSVTMEKSSFDVFEPTVVTVTAQNVSGKMQFYGPIGAGYSGFLYELRDSNGSLVRGHDILQLGSHRPVAPLAVPYKAGQARTADIPISLLWPIWSLPGPYTFEVYYLDSIYDSTPSYSLVASIQFQVNDPVGVAPEIVDTLKFAANAIFDMRIAEEIDSLVAGAVDTVQSIVSIPQHLHEFAGFLEALRLELTGSTGDWDGYTSQFPTSPWAIAASHGMSGLTVYRGVQPFTSQLEFPIILETRVLLEGAISADSMLIPQMFFDAVPLGQPYDDPAVWGFESLDTLGSKVDGMVDWILVTLVDTTAQPDSIVSTSVGVIYSNGWSNAEFYSIPSGFYQVVVEHRNHLAIASDTLVDFTSSFAQHDFTTGHAYGTDPQEIIVSGGDTVYAMFAADANADGHVTSADLIEWWWANTHYWMVGDYVSPDFTMDAIINANDYNYWLNNFHKLAESPHQVIQALYPNVPDNAPWTGEASAAASKTESTISHRMRYRVTGNAQHEPLGFAWVPLEVRTNSASVDTLGNATFDVYFNKDQMYYNVPQQYQELLDAGYFIEIHEGENEHGPFMRVDIGTAQPDTTRYLLDSTWDMLLRIGFKEEDGTITDHGVAANRGTADLGLLSNGVLTEPDSVAIWYGDAFQY